MMLKMRKVGLDQMELQHGRSFEAKTVPQVVRGTIRIGGRTTHREWFVGDDDAVGK